MLLKGIDFGARRSKVAGPGVFKLIPLENLPTSLFRLNPQLLLQRGCPLP